MSRSSQQKCTLRQDGNLYSRLVRSQKMVVVDSSSSYQQVRGEFWATFRVGFC